MARDEHRTLAKTVRIATLVVTTTATTIESLLTTALALLSPAGSLPAIDEGSIAQINLKPASDILAQDVTWNSTITLVASTWEKFSSMDALTQIKLSHGSTTVSVPVIIYYV